MTPKSDYVNVPLAQPIIFPLHKSAQQAVYNVAYESQNQSQGLLDVLTPLLFHNPILRSILIAETMPIKLSRTTSKSELLAIFRNESAEVIKNAKSAIPASAYKKQAVLVNKGVLSCKNVIINSILTQADAEEWSAEERLNLILMTTYVSYVVMLEARNTVWPYEYMAFARRVGELWEPFCFLCWKYPINQSISFIEPPTFVEVKHKLADDIKNYASQLNLDETAKTELLNYYDIVWNLVGSGEISLASDLHFKDEEKKYIVDFKSGFSSNEKGNTNRLLTVASIYKAIGGYECFLFVRAKEEYNNHYLQTLKKSGLWRVYCGDDTYDQISKFAGFNLSEWIAKNISWEEDFSSGMYNYLKENKLIQYLEW